MASKLSGIELTRYDDLFKTDAEREADRQERIQIVPAAEIFPYSRQPYTIDRPTPDLVRLMDSIEHIGIAEPLIVRPRDAGGYEIISGHRRDYCAKVVGLDTRPVIVRNYSDEEADILVVDYNINREDLLPSEKAKAYKLKLDAMKRQAGRPSKNSAQVGQNFQGRFSVELLAEQVNESRMQIQRYVRLNKLISPLLDAVDTGTLKFVPAADFISHLSEKEQTYLLLVMERDEVSPSLGQAQRLKQLSAEGKLENNIIDLVMREENRWSARLRSAMTVCKNTFRPAIPRSRWRRSSSSCWKAGTASASKNRADEEVQLCDEINYPIPAFLSCLLPDSLLSLKMVRMVTTPPNGIPVAARKIVRLPAITMSSAVFRIYRNRLCWQAQCSAGTRPAQTRSGT